MSQLKQQIARLEQAAAARLARASGRRLLIVGGIVGPPIMRGDAEWRRLIAEGHAEDCGAVQANGAQRVILAGRRVFVGDEALPA